MSKIITIWEEKPSGNYVKFVFQGHLTEQASIEAINKLKKFLDAKQNSASRINLIWNCQDMTGYDSQARIIWQSTLKENYEKLGDIWLITSNQLFKMAAKTMALLTKFKLRTASSEHDLHSMVKV